MVMLKFNHKNEPISICAAGVFVVQWRLRVLKLIRFTAIELGEQFLAKRRIYDENCSRISELKI